MHKLGIALKELNETEVWLDMVFHRGMVEANQIGKLRQECGELCRILAASVKTMEKRIGKPG